MRLMGHIRPPRHSLQWPRGGSAQLRHGMVAKQDIVCWPARPEVPEKLQTIQTIRLDFQAGSLVATSVNFSVLWMSSLASRLRQGRS
jgi:hypothetical protein